MHLRGMAISNDGLTEGAKIGGKLKKLYPTLWLSAFMLSGSQLVAQEQGDRTSGDCVVNLEPFRPQPDPQGGGQDTARPPGDPSDPSGGAGVAQTWETLVVEPGNDFRAALEKGVRLKAPGQL